MPYAEGTARNRDLDDGRVPVAREPRQFHRHHQQNQSFAASPSPSVLTFADAHQSSGEALYRLTHRPTRSVPYAALAMGIANTTSTSAMLNALEPRREKGEETTMSERRADLSQGSWLEGSSYSSHSHEGSADGDPFDLEDYLVASSESELPYSQPSPVVPDSRPQKRVITNSSSHPVLSRSDEQIRDRRRVESGAKPLAQFDMIASKSPSSFELDSNSLDHSRAGSDGDGIYDLSPSNFIIPQSSAPLPDPSNFPDPYPFGLSHHRPASGTPALSSAGSSSTRSSAYTNPGSVISSISTSGDYGNVRIASSEDMVDGIGLGITADTVVELLSHSSTGTSLVPGSRKSHGSQIDRLQRADYMRSSRSHSISEDHAPLQLARKLRAQPSYDTSWQRDSEYRDELGMTSEEEFEFENEEAGSIKEEEELHAAIAVAEEGRGLIVRGDGLAVSQLTIQPGTTHLLVGGSCTPNSVPSFLSTTLPQISNTLLALDISANFLAYVSPVLASCSVLEELNISSNPLRALPAFLSELSSLRVLIADSTGISTLPEPLSALDKLHTLSIRRNKFHSLPSWLCLLPCLDSLLVDGNPFQGPWKALVDPLLAKLPMTPTYPPSTPMFPQSSASGHSTNTTTTAEDTDNSDAEELTDLDDATNSTPPITIPASAPVDSRFLTGIDEELTITPSSAHLLERSATSPAQQQQQPPASRPLSRNRTTPNKQFYEREQAVRAGNAKQVEVMASGGNFEPSSSTSTARSDGRGEIRRMRSADELSRALQAGGLIASADPSSSRPGFKHSVTSAADADFAIGRRDETARKFASLGVHSRGPSRAGNRPFANSLWNEQGIDEDGDGELDEVSRPSSRVWSHPSGQRQRGESSSGSQGILGLKPKSADKEKSSRKWGFFKKMSMGKMRDVDDGSQKSRSSKSVAAPLVVVPSVPGPSGTGTLRRLTPPQLEITPQPMLSIASTSKTRLPLTPSSAEMASPNPTLRHQPSTDRLRIPSPSPNNNLLAPPSPSPLSASAKRRSFLPLDGPPALNIPIPSSAPFLPGITASNGADDIEDNQKLTASPVAENLEEQQRKEEERIREVKARALRSVMNYLRDMNDLTMASPGNPMSMYGSPPNERSRRPTLSDARLQSEASLDSMDTSSSTASSHLRSLDSISANRSASSNATMSIATSDSSGSCEERKVKDDRAKRARIVREIVETERTYVRTLQELVDIYVRPACAPVTTIGGVTVSSGKDQVVPVAERKIVFGDVESLYSFHKGSFLPALENASRPLLSPEGAAEDTETEGKLSSEVAMAVGRTFSSHAAFMKMYSSYINNLDNALQRVKQWTSDRQTPVPAASGFSTPSSSSTQLANIGLAMTAAITAPGLLVDPTSVKNANLSSGQRKRIKAYLKRCRVNPRHSQLNLEGYLHLPVQRITRYPLLLDELVRNTPRPTDSFDDPIASALSEISSLATNMNEGKREAESRRKLVQWQARIRGKFPSPLVQPHRRLIKDGKLLLTRIVRKQTVSFDVLDSHGDPSSIAVDCLTPELTPRPLYAILCNDLFVLCRDPSSGQDPTSVVDLWAVLRMQTMPQPTSIVHGNSIRVVDTKAILYLEAPSPSEALNWYRAINLHVPMPSPQT